MTAPGTGDVAPDAVAPPPGHRRFPLFDGLRAIAVILIVVFHTPGLIDIGWEPLVRVLVHLNVGVTVFFLISGFLLYRPFVAHRAGGPAVPGAAVFYKRRFLRIFPAYWVCLMVLLIVPDAISLSTPNLLAQFGLVHTLPFVGDGNCVQQGANCSLSQTWSLAVEVTFYAALPLYVIAANRLARGRETLSWALRELVLLAALSAVALFYTYWIHLGTETSFARGTLIGYFDWFALGMGAAVVSVVAERHRTRLTDWIGRSPGLLWLGAAALFGALAAYLPITPYFTTRSDHVLANLGFGAVSLLLILPAAFDGGRGAPRRILANSVVSWIGLVSYGIFLWHLAVLIRLDREFESMSYLPMLLVGLGISVAIAAASYYVIERPILRFKTRPLLARRH